MAGESPDKSDKKQSSGKTARNKRDPRLSAFRGEPAEPAKEPGAGTDSKPEKEPEAAAAPKPAAKPESGAKPGSGVTSEPASGAESGDSSEVAGEAGASEASEAPQGGAEGPGGAEGGDDRLRAAVAAWVAGGDEEGAGAGDGEGEGQVAAGAGDGETSVASGARDEDADGADDVDGDADGAVAKPEAKPEAKPDAKLDAKPEAKGGAGADAAEVKASDVASSDVASSDAKAGKKADGKAAAEAAVKGEAAPEANDKANDKAKDKANDKGDGEVDGGGGAASAGSAPEAESKGGAEAQSGGKAGSESPAAPKVVDQPTAVFKTVGPQKSKSDERVGAAAEGKAGGEGDEGEADGSAVDDATRVFAVAKLKGKGAAADAVDQATTTLKINPPAKATDAVKAKDAGKAEDVARGKAASQTKAESHGKADSKSEGKGKADSKDAAKADPKGAAKAGAKGDAKATAAPERDSERTSQFVALKSADDGTAGKSLGKTAPRTPARTADKAVEKPTDKPEGKTADRTADKAAGKPEGKATGVLPTAEPAKPVEPAKPANSAVPAAAPAKPDGRPGAMPPAAGATAADGPAALPESERTKQQPLPPLDLLAKLTNTPPPPETPLRTVARRFKIWTPLAVLLAIIFVVAQAVRPLPNPTLTLGDAASSFTFEGGKLAIPWPAHGQAAVKVVGSGDLGTFGPQKPVPTASVAKIMTAYVILRDHPLKKDEKGPKIEVDAKAVAEGGSTSESRIEGLKAGQKFSEQDMLKMLMIPSGNNIARLLARWDTKSDNEAAFVKKMNAAAKDLGMKNSTYTDPSGLDPKTVSTAVDQLKLAEAIMKFDAFRPIVAMTNADIPGLPGRINSNIDNLLLAGLSIKGIKTGSSTAAGGTLSWAAYKTVDGKDQLVLGTMMDQHFKGLDPNGSNSLTLVKNNSQKVIEAVRNALTSTTAVKKGQVVGYVDDGLNGRTPVVATKDLKAVGVPGQKLELSVGDGGKTVPHTAKAGTEVGVLTVGNGERSQKVPVALQKDLGEPSFGAKLVRIT
ncbi:D-alanyl-D-alanine carboxypeptidase [Streptomyces decoyicus]|nr:D-alanyl-D-alanine carboxypeptidase [Streptomyces decoyicus]QZY20579.1 D-alanyl-D-alanine carboxypeptidase [Streptomyces decoyicus]